MVRNRVFRVVIIFSLCFFKTVASAEPTSRSLKEIFERVVKQSESLQISAQNIKTAQAQYNEAISAVYPQIQLKLTERVRDSSDSTAQGSSGSNSGFVGNRDDRFQSAINLTQPLFSGFRDFLIADAAEYEISAREYVLERQRETLFEDVAELFYQIILYEKDLKELSKTESVLKERLNELSEFIKLGKSKASEGLSAQADLAEIEVTRAQVSGVLTATKELLSFLTGVPSAEIRLQESPELLRVEPLGYYLSFAKDRNDLKALTRRALSQEKRITAAERERWPTISLEGNYYPLQSPDNGQDAEVLLTLNLPLIDAGRIDARIEQQKSTKQSTELQMQELNRSIERDIRVAYAHLEQAKNEKDRLKILVDTTKSNYESQKRDYALGVVTNLDVLQAIRKYQDAKRRLLKSEVDEKITRVRLLVASGSGL